MTTQEKTVCVQTMLGSDIEVPGPVVSAYLSLASSKMLSRLYPFDTTKTEADIPSVYDMIQCELAVRLIARQGGEGEISHSENGISRNYGSVDDDDILQRLTPYIRLV